MKYSVYQHWDPLKVCIVGRSYSPEFYSFITNSRARTVMERIAYETEEDYQKLIKLLESFGVEVLRPELTNNYTDYLDTNGKILQPPMAPRDISIMVGNDFYWMTSGYTGYTKAKNTWGVIRGEDWPENFPETYDEFLKLPEWVRNEYFSMTQFDPVESKWKNVLDHIKKHANAVTSFVYYDNKSYMTPENFNSAKSTRVGKDIYVGTNHYGEDLTDQLEKLKIIYPEYRWHSVNTGGHSDGTYCPVVPGLIVSLQDIPTYKDTFPGWEVIYLPGQSWTKVQPFLDLKEKNQGKWWVPGEELNDSFTDFVEQWLGHWVGYVEETVFDVNMLVIDEKNVVCNNYNEEVFKAFDRYGITPHVVNFRHRYFWDSGLHCITSDVHREGTMKDYFPERG